MKTPLKALSLLFALGFPSALFAQFAGASVPTAIDPGHLFAAFVAALTLLIVWSDYSREDRPRVRRITRGTQPTNLIPLQSLPVDQRLAA